VSDKEVATYRYKLEELIHDEKSAVSESKEFGHKVAELEAEIAQSKLDLARTEVRAPFAGFITTRTVNIGQRLRPMDALFNLGSFAPLYADVHLSEKDTRNVRSGQPALVRLGSDDAATVHGRVERISPIVEQSSGTVKVTVAMDPQPGFRPGSFVRVEIRTDTKADATVIPKRALIEEDGNNYVYVAQNDTAKRTKVELGYEREGLVEIRKGVEPGQNVVVAGQGALKEGGKIKVLSASQRSAGA
jgi:RND family efflux transporter MFP subunit